MSRNLFVLEELSYSQELSQKLLQELSQELSKSLLWSGLESESLLLSRSLLLSQELSLELSRSQSQSLSLLWSRLGLRSLSPPSRSLWQELSQSLLWSRLGLRSLLLSLELSLELLLSRSLEWSLELLLSRSLESLESPGSLESLESPGSLESLESPGSLLLSLLRSLLLWLLLLLSRSLKWSLLRSYSRLQEMLSELEKSERLKNNREQANNANLQSHALKLPGLIRWINDETKVWLIDMRIDWYGKPPFSRKTHIDIWLQTHKYIIFDHFLFRLWDKITSRSLYHDRIIRFKDSSK